MYYVVSAPGDATPSDGAATWMCGVWMHRRLSVLPTIRSALPSYQIQVHPLQARTALFTCDDTFPHDLNYGGLTETYLT